MQLSTTLLTLALTTLTTATPITPLNPRAGGPIGKPIPSNCTQTNPLPASTHASSVSGFRPDPDFTSINLLYASYFTSSLPSSELATQCFEQCYGYGDGGECIAALSARDVPVPEGYYGSPGGDLMTACLLYKEFLNPGGFVESEEGTWRGMLGVDISCPEEEEGEKGE